MHKKPAGLPRRARVVAMPRRPGDAKPAGEVLASLNDGDGAVDCVSAAVLGEAQQAGVGRDGRDVEFGGLDRRP